MNIKPSFSFITSLGTPWPLRDWVIVLVLGWVGAIALSATAIYFFLGIRSGSFIDTSPGTSITAERLDRVKLEKLVNALEARRVEYDAGRVSVPVVADPSR